MDVKSTKDRYELETEEANRLVRPAPKVKPPRTDLRREEMESDRDSDTESDPDFADAPKRGSLAARVAARVLFADGPMMVKVKRKDTGTTTYIRPETLKEKPDEYEMVEDEPEEEEEEEEDDSEEEPEEEDNSPPQEPTPPQESKPQNPLDDEDMGPLFKGDGEKDRIDGLKKLRNLSKSDPRIDQILDHLLTSEDPDTKLLSKMYPGSQVSKWYKTLGDLRGAIKELRSSNDAVPEAPKKDPEAPKEEESKEEHEDDAEDEDRIDSLKQLAEGVRHNPEARDEIRKFTDLKEPDSKPMAELVPKGSPILKWCDTLGELREAMRDLPHVQKPEEPEPIEKSDEGTSEPKDDSEDVDLNDSEPKDEEDDDSEDVDFDEDDSEDVDLNDTSSPEPKTEETPKAPDKAKPTDKPKTSLHPEDRKNLDDWLLIEGPRDSAFRSWAGSQPGAREKDGQVLFQDPVRKKLIPFSELPEKKQWELKQKYDHTNAQAKLVDSLKEAERADPKLQKALTAIGDPESDLSKTLQESLDKDPRTLPEFQGVDIPDSIDFVRDLIAAARQVHKPIQKPKQREFSEQERIQALSHIVSTFPPDVAYNLMRQKLHPDDVAEMVSSFHVAKEAKPKSIEEAKDILGGTYTLNPAEVTNPPRFGHSLSGQEIPFDELSPEEQATAMQKHRMRTVAISLAARESVIDKLSRKTGTSEELLGPIVDFSLGQPKNEPPGKKSERAQKEAKKAFLQTLANGPWDKTDNSRWGGDDAKPSKEDEDDPNDNRPEPSSDISEYSDGEIRRVLDNFKDDPPAQQMAVGFLQAADYHLAKKKFLDTGLLGTAKLSEYHSVGKIKSGLKEAADFFDQQAKRYPIESRWVNDPSKDFRNRILEKIRTLSPEKYPELLKWNEEFEDKDYERKSREWEKTFKTESPYREQGFTPPPRPVEPTGYKVRNGSPKDNRQMGKDLLEDHRRQTEEGTTPSQDVVDRTQRPFQAQERKILKKYSSYSKHLAMTDRKKQAVYSGVDPYPKDMESYPKGHPFSQRDLGSKDFDGLVSAARDWMKSSVLSDNIEGIPKETQVEAALDLALRTEKDGQYSAGLLPTEYSDLVGRLMGKSAADRVVAAVKKHACEGGCSCGTLKHTPSSNESLSQNPNKEPGPMKASSELRQFAARIASTQPEMAYELAEISKKVAQQEQQSQQDADQKSAGKLPPEFLENIKKKEDGAKDKEEGQGQSKQASTYAALRSHVIRLANANPHLREAYLPLLESIKQLG